MFNTLPFCRWQTVNQTHMIPVWPSMIASAALYTPTDFDAYSIISPFLIAAPRWAAVEIGLRSAGRHPTPLRLTTAFPDAKVSYERQKYGCEDHAGTPVCCSDKIHAQATVIYKLSVAVEALLSDSETHLVEVTINKL